MEVSICSLSLAVIEHYHIVTIHDKMGVEETEKETLRKTELRKERGT